MKTLIQAQIKELELRHNIRILFAIESGSRAWGFPSPDSDYDVRFIYAQPLDWYLTIQDKKDTLDFPINGELDIGGWDIKKAMLLLKKSNAPLLEWMQSPIIYKVEPGFSDALKALCGDFYSPKAVMHHYLSMAKKHKTLIEESGDKVRLKTYFYALRAALAGNWILHHDTVPPIEFSKLLYLVEDNAVRNQILELIAVKGVRDESFVYQRNAQIEQLIDDLISDNDTQFPNLKASKGDVGILDAFFRKIVKQEYLKQ